MIDSLYAAARQSSDEQHEFTLDDLVALIKKAESVQTLSAAFSPLLARLRAQERVLHSLSARLDALLPPDRVRGESKTALTAESKMGLGGTI